MRNLFCEQDEFFRQAQPHLTLFCSIFYRLTDIVKYFLEIT